MTATTFAAPPAARPRRTPAPGLVVFACWLLGGVVAMRVAAAVAAIYAIPETSWLAAETEGSQTAGTAQAGLLIISCLISVVVAAAFLALALLTGAGFAAARIVTWVASGLTVCGGVPVLLLSVVDTVGWYRALTNGLTGATLAFAVAASVLLSLPAANRYFRTRTAR